MGRFRESAFYSSLALELKVGDELNLDDLVEHLRSVGYEPGEPVAAVGQYSVRGGIVDVFPPEAEWPFRLEFFGDQLESVREFDPSSQRSRKPVPQALLLPLSEAQRSPQFFERLVRVLTLRAREHAQARGTPLPDREPEWAAEHSNTFPGWEFFVPLVEPHTHTLFSLLDRPVLIWDEFLDRRAQVQPILAGSGGELRRGSRHHSSSPGTPRGISERSGTPSSDQESSPNFTQRTRAWKTWHPPRKPPRKRWS